MVQPWELESQVTTTLLAPRDLSNTHVIDPCTTILSTIGGGGMLVDVGCNSEQRRRQRGRLVKFPCDIIVNGSVLKATLGPQCAGPR